MNRGIQIFQLALARSRARRKCLIGSVYFSILALAIVTDYSVNLTASVLNSAEAADGVKAIRKSDTRQSDTRQSDKGQTDKRQTDIWESGTTQSGTRKSISGVEKSSSVKETDRPKLDASGNSDHPAVETKNLWKLSVPRKAISPNKLPVGQLVFFLRKRKVEEIRQLLKETPVHHGDGDERLMWEATCLSTKNRIEQAVILFDKVKNIDSAPVLVIAKAAQAYAGDAQYDKAVRLCNIALAKFEMSDVYQIRAGCYGATGRLSEAAADFEKVALLGGSPSRYYSRAASLLLKAGKTKDAFIMIDRGMKVVPPQTAAALFMVRADCYKSLSRWQDAVNCISEAIKLTRAHKASPGGEDEVILSTCYKERAYCYQKLGQTNLAKNDLKTLEESSKGIADEIIGDR
ncbi:MAG: tetratricopeptide repeat protein [Candidatus Obscuribacterales bacterium]|jgi:tetratricopeptide (TPR) repeat protein